MTSVEREVDLRDAQSLLATVATASEIAVRVFGEVFGLEPVPIDADVVAHLAATTRV
jgi:hypothetical protein